MIQPSLSEEAAARLAGMERLARLMRALVILAAINVVVAVVAMLADAGWLAGLGVSLVALLIMAASHLTRRRFETAQRAMDDLMEEWRHASVRP